ncbi:MazG nucleotide pyrophosphohydrolase domain protein [uncultured archaeon]|nr:MazG nucleotide pyrophosphohydrolase domain protein [uncultured archaeon]
MKKTMSEFLEILELNKKRCPWLRVQSMEYMMEEMKKEIREVEEALEKGDMENLEEELGDIAWDYFGVLTIAELSGKADAKRVFKKLMKKVRHRKPYLFEEKHISVEESVRVWKQQKAKEVKAGTKKTGK